MERSGSRSHLAVVPDGHDAAPAPSAGLFKDVNALKRADFSERAELLKYNNAFFGKVATNRYFEHFTLVVILLNAVQIGIDADYSARHGTADLYKGPIIFAIVENFFAVFFTLEIVIRTLGHKRWITCVTDLWYIFDFILVIFMIIETWVLPFLKNADMGPVGILRLLRLLRITRMAKVMRAFPELLMIVKGINAAMSAVIWTAFLLVILTYTWAILFTNEYHQGNTPDSEVEGAQEFFGSMSKSMMSLLIMGTILDDVTACSDVIRSTENFWMLGAFILYVLIASFTILNLLVGILVEVVGNTKEAETTRTLESQMRDNIRAVFDQLDKNKNGLITRDEFTEMREHKVVTHALRDLNVTSEHLEMYADLCFGSIDSDEDVAIDFDQLLNLILRLRPGTGTMTLDFSAFRELVYATQAEARTRAELSERTLDQILAELDQADGVADSGDNVKASPSQDALAAETEAQRLRHVKMIAQLEGTRSNEIIAELQRRLGMGGVEASGVPVAMMVPLGTAGWSKDVFAC
eukprot:TRINITY_DN63380_c0_g1_i1.p1 TRINITY_DN63380_c0_g1~~TRINITY_DN63380_c0_g1_i1.p1  ORF type:complete len:524 (+),score=124.64 TRINITY_DN63380_c0_g1_i1:153-1724(+)